MSLGRHMLAICALFLIAALNNLWAMTVQSKGEKLGNPTYLNDHTFYINLDSAEINHRYFSSSKLIISYKRDGEEIFRTFKELTQSQTAKCSQEKTCTIKQIADIAFQTRSCEVLFNLISRSEEIIAEESIRWGACRGQEDRPIVDIDLSSSKLNLIKVDGNHPEEIKKPYSVSVQNLSPLYEYIAIGRDQNGKVIFSDRLYAGFEKAVFRKKLKSYQFEKVCTLELIADPYSEVLDKNLNNNTKKFEVGNCLGQNPIQYADYAITSDNQFLYIYNLNYFFLKETNIAIQIDVFDRNNHLVFQFDKSVPGSLEYHEFTIFDYTYLLTQENCKILLYLNPSRRIPETNYQNNFLEINHCHN